MSQMGSPPSVAGPIQQAQVCSCTLYSNQFSPGEPRTQQWSNRNTQRACVHAQCIEGGVGGDHSRHHHRIS